MPVRNNNDCDFGCGRGAIGPMHPALGIAVDRENVVLVAISLDPGAAQEADIEIPLWKFGLTDYDTLRAEDLMRGRQVVWTGKHQRVRLDPELPFAIWRVG